MKINLNSIDMALSAEAPLRLPLKTVFVNQATYPACNRKLRSFKEFASRLKDFVHDFNTKAQKPQSVKLNTVESFVPSTGITMKENYTHSTGGFSVSCRVALQIGTAIDDATRRELDKNLMQLVKKYMPETVTVRDSKGDASERNTYISFFQNKSIAGAFHTLAFCFTKS